MKNEAANGDTRVEMAFLPTVEVPCEGCSGARFEPATLEVNANFAAAVVVVAGGLVVIVVSGAARVILTLVTV